MKRLIIPSRDMVAACFNRADSSGDYAALGMMLLLIAAATEGDTLLESLDLFRELCRKNEKNLRDHWDQLRTEWGPTSKSGEP